MGNEEHITYFLISKRGEKAEEKCVKITEEGKTTLF
jgi:hypothetical protein